ncbi:phospholipase D family protein [Acinetobacter johnsonii]|uniref:phospholipase D family protein n=1 Tax=Acinetobacter johnsonii TaxID=40214 RepID=UPI003F56EEC0
MAIPTHCRPLILLSTVLTLAGCQLAPNQAKPSAPVEVYAEHWLKGQDASAQQKQGLTAYLALDEAFMSIASRLHLIREAKHSLDVQYYIWGDDFIGHMMLHELLNAADRGVKVRLLIDDQNGTALDETFKKLAAHPNFEIKLFNPYKYRHLRVIDYAFRFNHINHRMHNKLIIADGAIAVTGGRNISSEYFDASEKFQFTDLDILFYGQAVEHANSVFLSFWNDDLSYAIPQLVGRGTKEELVQLKQHYEADALDKNVIEQKIDLARIQVDSELTKHPVNWAKAHFIADSPNKIRGEAKPDEIIVKQMFDLMGKPEKHMELVSAYFVPTTAGADYLSNLAKNGTRVRILTNSLLANDVAIVHAFYKKYRRGLLENGVKLYEFKPYIEREKYTWYEVATGHVIPAKGRSSSRLHAKFFDIDGKVFVGSFNFDPRSAHLNTEVGLVVESDQLQNAISHKLDEFLPHIAYELKLNSQGDIIWLEHQKNGTVIEHQKEPETTKFQRFMMKAVSYLPIEWMM